MIGIGLGTLSPMTTVAMQNAVPPHQLGTATGVHELLPLARRRDPRRGFGAIFLGGAGADRRD